MLHYFDNPLVVEANAIAHVVGANVTQKQPEMKFYPISYFNQTMNLIEKGFCVCERKSFAIFWDCTSFAFFRIIPRVEIYQKASIVRGRVLHEVHV